jgi:hypothetical protein
LQLWDAPEKTTQITDFFVETLIALDQFDSEVGDLPGIIPLLSNAIFHTSG